MRLSKKHYSTNMFTGDMATALLDGSMDDKLIRYAQITGSLALGIEDATYEMIEKAVIICKKADASIALNYYAFNRYFGKDLPPTDREETYQKEMEFFQNRIMAAQDYVYGANHNRQCRVPIDLLIVDNDRLNANGTPEWDEGVRYALDDVYIRGNIIAPTLMIIRGVTKWENGWPLNSGWTTREVESPMSCNLYTVWDTDITEQTYRRTLKLADELQIKPVIPIVALAAGYVYPPNGGRIVDLDRDYDTYYDWLLGRQIASCKRSPYIIFWPPAFAATTPQWEKHFEEYCRGFGQ